MEPGTRENAEQTIPPIASQQTKTGGISMIISGKAVFSYIDGQLVLQEIAEDLTVEDIKNCTYADFIVSSDLKTIKH